ncbi:MAG: T9SS type A sorting domain-containing protein [Calditrichaeota bacterium]|nr:T9SS type A sorting domain-containing protein [Calditrichota bacterium]
MRKFTSVLAVCFIWVTFCWFSVGRSAEVKIIASDTEAYAAFGNSVSIFGDYAIVGASPDDGGGITDAGAAYIFIRNGDSWTEQAKLTASDAQADDYFGHSVSISGDYAIISAIGVDDGGDLAGAAYIFKRSGTTWTEQAKITASDAQANDYFGYSVSISGDYAIVGARMEDAGGGNAGAAYIFKRSGTNWTQQVKLTASDADAGDQFGWSVSISGDYAIVGADRKFAGIIDYAGAAYIFIRSGNTWTEQAKITASDEHTNNRFGHSVSISGDYAIVGAVYDYDGGAAGAAYIFNRSGTSWTQQAKITASDGHTDNRFGKSVSISGDYAIVGAYGDNAGGSFAGAFYSYLRSGVTWSQTSKTTASDAQANDKFGCSVSINGDNAIAGAKHEDPGNIDAAGAAYIYKSGADLSLPVELLSFTANAGDGQVTLKWSTASEVDNEAFILERSTDGDNFKLLTEIKAQGSISNQTDYAFTDNYVFNGVTYYYRLADRDINGVITYHTTVKATPNAKPDDSDQTGLIVKKFALHNNYPNPFNPETTIRFDVPTKDGDVKRISLNIFNSLGQLVTTLYSGEISGGQYKLKWNAANQPAGVYFLNFQSKQFVQTRKMILIR